MNFDGKNILVLGLGRTGISIAKALIQQKANVCCYDDEIKTNLDNIDIKVCNNISEIDFHKIDGLAVSPGIQFSWPMSHQVVKAARMHFIPIFSDLDIFLSCLNQRQKVIAITGTNGKSTTTALIYHILRSNAFNVEIGGNIGNPVLNLRLDADIYVLELSSYQLDLTSNTHFTNAILLNITPDHLARHGGMAGYIAAKEKVFLDNDTNVIIGVDDEYCCHMSAFLELTGRHITQISGRKIPQNGIGWDADGMYCNSKRVLDIADAKHLNGIHNFQNIAASFAALRDFGITIEQFKPALRTFAGLEHRQEVLKAKGIVFVNDSKATNADATEYALDRFINSDIIWIAGGLQKEGGITSLKQYFSKIKEAILFGAASDEFSKTIGNDIPIQIVANVNEALQNAYAACSKYKNPIVLFSPACASFDQFKSFEERGRVFKHLVDKILGGNTKWH